MNKRQISKALKDAKWVEVVPYWPQENRQSKYFYIVYDFTL
jgi:hypothetical protein